MYRLDMLYADYVSVIFYHAWQSNWKHFFGHTYIYFHFTNSFV